MRRSNTASRVLPFAVTGLFLIVCLLLPLLFLDRGSGYEPTFAPDAGERAELYSRYSSGELQSKKLSESEVDNDSLIACTRLVNSIMNTLVMDEGYVRLESSSGFNYFTLADGDDTVRIMEYYREWTADWHNWFTIHIDLDTQDVYYLYYSANMLQNEELYVGTAQAHLESAGQGVLLELGFSSGGTLKENGDDSWDLGLVSSDGESYTYRIDCNIYEDAAPSLLVDLKATLTGISGV